MTEQPEGSQDVPPVDQPPPAYAPPPPGYPPPPAGGYGVDPYGQYAQPVPPGMYFDQASGVVLPEGVQLASVGRRIGAFFLGALLSILTLGIGYLVWGLIVWGNGTSPALQVLGMKCWKPAEHRVASWGTMALRDIVGGLVQGVFFGIGGLISFIMFLANKDHRSLADMIGSTVVVHDPNKVLG